VSDVTDARLADRLKDDLLREKAILFQELQHRVANSLQIIASVLMLSARRASAESRGHLKDAHSRIMSVATLQQQLAARKLGDVELRGYFSELCASIAASMIPDPERITLSVTADDSVSPGDTSVSLGLIVTELVINALKHAFPGDRAGGIVVSYGSHAADWTLSVRDDGVGMAGGGEPVQAGLGSSIVEALARQLDARVQVVDAEPGTNVSIIHAGGLIGAAHAQALHPI
jgi:two-component sensor histidine kinase